MADDLFATHLANNYLNDKGGIEESLMAGGDTGVGQAPSQIQVNQQADIQANDDPAKQGQIVLEGQSTDTPPQTPIVASSSGPKYRTPTKEEADQHIADTKAMMTIGSGILGVAVGGVPGTLAGIGAKAASEHFGPKIENHIRNSEWVPIHENWTENDFHNEYGGR